MPYIHNLLRIQLPPRNDDITEEYQGMVATMRVSSSYLPLMSATDRKEISSAFADAAGHASRGGAWYSRFIQRQNDGSYYIVFNVREVEKRTERTMVRALSLAESAMQSMDFAAAARHYRSFLRYDPSHAQVYTRLAHAELKLGDTAAAIESAETAMELDASLRDAAIVLAVCQAESGNLA
ncbi:MAG: tetratricopeptide repeat protein [Candidatus Kapaibacterium sp.]